MQPRQIRIYAQPGVVYIPVEKLMRVMRHILQRPGHHLGRTLCPFNKPCIVTVSTTRQQRQKNVK